MTNATDLGERENVWDEPIRAPEQQPVQRPLTDSDTARPRTCFAAAGVLIALVAAFAGHLAALGAWVIDDAGISIAYGLNLANGHGLVAQPGAAPVEGFSNPLWVILLAILSRMGLLGRGELFGVSDYVVVIKSLAILLQAVVLICLGLVILRVLAMTQRREPSLGLTLTCWAAAGALLAANPSYVIWMGSGLENPLLAAEVSVLAAIAVYAVPNPTRRSMVALGAVGGFAALTRPDGAIYALVLVAVALLSTSAPARRRWSALSVGVMAFGVVFGSYWVFRLLYFRAWLPNTATAKSQGLPSAASLFRTEEIVWSFGPALVAISMVGGATAWWSMYRAGNVVGIRVVAAGTAVLAAAIVAFVVLPKDWMGELRFLTPAWPLLSVAATLAIVQLAAVSRSRHLRTTCAVLLVSSAVLVVPTWWERTKAFRASPTLPLCTVATRFGQHFNIAARSLRLDPRASTVLLPDVGGTLLVSSLEVVDLAGLTDRNFAELLHAADPEAIADYIFDDLQPTFIHTHGHWTLRSNLTDNPRLASDYFELIPGADWVRRDALAETRNIDRVAARLQAHAATAQRTPPRTSCGELLFA